MYACICMYIQCLYVYHTYDIICMYILYLLCVCMCVYIYGIYTCVHIYIHTIYIYISFGLYKSNMQKSSRIIFRQKYKF